jgi:shikimate kinase
MDFMNANGVTIYIAPETEVLATRLLNSKTERPLIAGKKRAELITFINQALIIRAPFYEKATITIRDQQDLDPQFVVSEIQSLGLNG